MRKLASIQKIIDIQPIPNADAIEVVTVLGWKVVSQKNTFKIGDLCMYFEIDSLLPELPMFEFLRPSSWREKLNAYRLKTVKLRGQISQGLTIPLSEFAEYEPEGGWIEGADFTDILKIDKYEPPITDGNEGQSKPYNWDEVDKTDEIRIQADPSMLEQMQGEDYYISVKLDGTSATFILSKKIDGVEFNVCGRNICFARDNVREKEDGTTEITLNDNKYWKIADKYEIEANMLAYYLDTGRRLALQGELVGPNIQGNKLNLSDKDIYIFNVYETNIKDEFVKLDIERALEIVDLFKMKFVPIIEKADNFNYNSIDELLDKAKGDYREYFPNAKHDQPQEGIVIRTQDSTQSFKVINNDFLLKGGDE